MLNHKYYRYASPVVMGLALYSGSGSAQGDDGRKVAFEEIVITAQKRESNVQSTPISMSALSSSRLEEEGVNTLGDIAAFTPGLVVGGNSGFQFPISIRGISSAPNGIGSDSPTAIYVDGVYLGRPTSGIFDMVDLERIEVLRGPQGTLYGRNTVGGAISLISKKPSDELEVFGSAGWSDLEEWRVKGSVSGPISEKAGFRLSASYRDTSDWLDSGDGRRIFSGNSLSLRGAISLDPSDTVSLMLRGDYSKVNDPYGAKRIELLGTTLPLIDDYDTLTTDEAGFVEREIWGLSAQADIDIGALALTSISSYRESFARTQIGSDGTPVRVLRVGSPPGEGEVQSQYSQEFRLSSPGGEFVDWIVGAYFFTESGVFDIDVENYGAGVVVDHSVTGKTVNFAGFGQADVHLTEAVTLTAGLRYGWERKDFTFQSQVLPLAVNPDVNVPIVGAPNSGNLLADDSTSWASWTPKLGINWDVNEDVMLYASIARGFKSGGYNTLSPDPSFDPEKVTAYEVGIKSDLMDGRLRVNASGFYYDYTNLQVRVPIDVGVIQTKNAATAEVYGGELEVQAAPVDNLLITAALSLVHARYEEFLQTPVVAAACAGGAYDAVTSTCDLSGNTLNRAPSATFSVSAQYEFELANEGTLTPRVSFQYEGEAFYTEQNLPYQGHDGWQSLDARLTYTTADDGITVALYGKNLTNDRYYPHSLPIGTAFTIATGPNKPRVFGAEVSFRY